MILTSRQNETIKHLVKLHDKRGRSKTKQFLVEGDEEILRALEASYPIDKLFYCPALYSRKQCQTVWKHCEAHEVPLQEVNESVFEKITQRESSDGLIALASVEQQDLSTLALPTQPLILILDQLEKPGNLGALARSAYASGIDCICLNETPLEWFNPNAIRSSRGMVFKTPIINTETCQLLDFISAHKLQTVITCPQTSTHYWDLDYTPGTAIVLGNEHTGLDDFWHDIDSVHPVTIPMQAGIDSLNVATSAALLTYEAKRQRSLES